MATIEKLGHVRFHGMLGDKDISAVTFWSQRVLVVAAKLMSWAAPPPLMLLNSKFSVVLSLAALHLIGVTRN